MGKTIEQWEKEVKRMTDVQLGQCHEALTTLDNWKFFKDAYEDTGTKVIGTILKHEIKRRKREKENGEE